VAAATDSSVIFNNINKRNERMRKNLADSSLPNIERESVKQTLNKLRSNGENARSILES